MFKNATIYKITLPQPMLVGTLHDAATGRQFTPCGATQVRSFGWVPPRGHEHGPMVENIGGHLIMKLMIETRTIPSEALKRAVDAAAKKIEDTEGRKPGKKERRELAENATLEMLPHAFTSRTAATAWIDPEAGRLVVDATSDTILDPVTSEICQLADGIKLQPLTTMLSPSSVMGAWLADGEKLSSNDRFGFDIGRSCVLKSTDETKATVRYTKCPLDTEEVRNHLLQGKAATMLELSHQGRVSFDLNANGAMRKINFLDVVFESNTMSQHADYFDADVAIMTGELSKLIPYLIDAMGGEWVQPSEPTP